MKNESAFLKRIPNLLAFLITAFIATSCSDDGSDMQNASLSTDLEDIEIIAEVEEVGQAIDDLSDVLSDELTSLNASKSDLDKSDFFKSFYVDCVVTTIVVEGNAINVKLDFGGGCEGPHGKMLKGVILTDIQHVSDQLVSVNHSFENFFIDDMQISGSIAKTKNRQNEDGFPEANISRDITVTWTDGVRYNRMGEFKRTFIEGFGNKIWGDNVFLLEGSWKVSRNGESLRTVEIINPLRREAACRFHVSGTLQIESIERGTYELDFGAGECDNKAVVTKGDTSVEIELGKRRHRRK